MSISAADASETTPIFLSIDGFMLQHSKVSGPFSGSFEKHTTETATDANDTSISTELTCQ